MSNDHADAQRIREQIRGAEALAQLLQAQRDAASKAEAARRLRIARNIRNEFKERGYKP